MYAGAVTLDLGTLPLRALSLALIVGMSSGVAAAQPCDPDEAEVRTGEIRAHLDHEARRARRWNLGWGIGFATLSLAQGSLIAAEWTPLGDYDDDAAANLYVGTAKSTIASLAHLIVPLKIVRAGAATGDACADLAAAERALRKSGSNEKQSFWLNHLGAIALNGGGLLVLGIGFDTWKEGVISVAMGYPMGLLHAYTQPRRSWHAVRNGRLLRPAAPTVAWQLGAVHTEHYTGLVLGGTF